MTLGTLILHRSKMWGVQGVSGTMGEAARPQRQSTIFLYCSLVLAHSYMEAKRPILKIKCWFFNLAGLLFWLLLTEHSCSRLKMSAILLLSNSIFQCFISMPMQSIYNPCQTGWDTLPFKLNCWNICSLPSPLCNVGSLFNKTYPY